MNWNAIFTDHLSCDYGARNPLHPRHVDKASLPYLQATQGHQFESGVGQTLPLQQPPWHQQLFPAGLYPYMKHPQISQEIRAGRLSQATVLFPLLQGMDSLLPNL